MVKAYFLIRQDLQMSVAKLAIQVGHGVDLIHMNQVFIPEHYTWITSDRIKILLQVEDEQKLKAIWEKLQENSIMCIRIHDSGYTEFPGRTLTGIVICPIEEDNAPKIIKRLRLWK